MSFWGDTMCTKGLVSECAEETCKPLGDTIINMQKFDSRLQINFQQHCDTTLSLADGPE